MRDTSTREVANKLLAIAEDYSMASGRVLTLIVLADAEDDEQSILSATRDASHEHPSRVIVVVSHNKPEPPKLNARILVGNDSGASEIIILSLRGELAEHPDSVVTPLLLPDTPIVAWWPTTAPANPKQHPIGQIAQRRITNARHNVTGNALLRINSGYQPGDSDMMWSRLTMWRGVVASALDRPPHEPVEHVTISGPATNPSVDIAAGWLADRLEVPVVRETLDVEDDLFGIRRLVIQRASGSIVFEIEDATTMRLEVPGSPAAYVALSRRSDADCLAEELRHLEPDLAFEKALHALGKVTVN